MLEAFIPKLFGTKDTNKSSVLSRTFLCAQEETTSGRKMFLVQGAAAIYDNTSLSIPVVQKEPRKESTSGNMQSIARILSNAVL